MVTLCLMWTVWKEHNQRIFENVECMGSQLLAAFSNSLFDWFHTWGFMNCDSIAVFLEVCLYIIFLCKSFVFFMVIVFEVVFFLIKLFLPI